MQTILEKLQNQKYLLLILIATALLVLVSNVINEVTAKWVTQLIYFPITSAVVVLSFVMAKRFHNSGHHGKAWILFLFFAIAWFAAEAIWFIYELVLEIDPYPSPADGFWLAGYPLLFFFMIMYLRPVEKGISRKILTTSIILSTLVLIPTLFTTYSIEDLYEAHFVEHIIAISYPIGDAIILAPAIIGILLFFKGKVNFLWALICLAILCDVAADTGFLITQFDDSYYSAHPIEILFIWSYILFAFGIHNQISIFKKSSKELHKYDNVEDLR